jgi:thiamine biosynthesis protein ThiS
LQNEGVNQVEFAIVVNGQAQTAREGETVLDILRRLALDPARVAVEFDRRIVRQPLWGQTLLHDGAQLEIVQFVGGG